MFHKLLLLSTLMAVSAVDPNAVPAAPTSNNDMMSTVGQEHNPWANMEVAGPEDPDNHYPYAHVENLSPYEIHVKVTYMSIFCSDDEVTIAPGQSWTADSRGVCLITEVSSTMKLPEGEINCIPYESSGTSYSQFMVAYKAPLKCLVTRIVNESGPEDRQLTEQDEPENHYPYAHVENLSPYEIHVKVTYMSLFCSDDEVTIAPGQTWTATSRGVCLITQVSSTMNLPQGQIDCTPYTSSGTSYSQFMVAYKAPLQCLVSRIVNESPQQSGLPKTEDASDSTDDSSRMLQEPINDIVNEQPRLSLRGTHNTGN